MKLVRNTRAAWRPFACLLLLFGAKFWFTRKQSLKVSSVHTCSYLDATGFKSHWHPCTKSPPKFFAIWASWIPHTNEAVWTSKCVQCTSLLRLCISFMCLTTLNYKTFKDKALRFLGNPYEGIKPTMKSPWLHWSQIYKSGLLDQMFLSTHPVKFPFLSMKKTKDTLFIVAMCQTENLHKHSFSFSILSILEWKVVYIYNI